MAALPQDWFDSAVAITASFETSGDPYVSVSGDFDGMGISCGVLQWNIGQGSLPPLVKAVGKSTVTAAMPVHGKDMWTACNGSIKAGLKIVRSWQSGISLKAKPKAELAALMGTAAMRAEQTAAITIVADRAFAGTTKWATSSGNAPSKRQFCWFYDMATQNGSLEGLTPKAVADFISQNTPDKADDLICDFLKNMKGSSGHVKDSHQNAKLWRNKANADELEVLCMTYLRSKTANPKWQHVVVNRKGSIAMGEGWVNGSLRDFSGYGL